MKGIPVSKHILRFHVNDRAVEVAVEPWHTLANVLRNDLNLTGTKIGCDMGTCGCCTVHVDGKARLSCLTLALECQGAKIATIEGLNEYEIHPLQRAFAECGGSQCGYCTPGFIMQSCAMLKENPDPTRDEIKAGLSGNLCRCTGFMKIYEAVERAATEMREKPVSAPVKA
ncbi:MAG: (2Fe-2S)-binding protein [Planctomycetes bacterium]|nr:(2Fe-2S)-binding protein [Planctomycetota bacterium]